MPWGFRKLSIIGPQWIFHDKEGAKNFFRKKLRGKTNSCISKRGEDVFFRKTFSVGKIFPVDFDKTSSKIKLTFRWSWNVESVETKLCFQTHLNIWIFRIFLEILVTREPAENLAVWYLHKQINVLTSYSRCGTINKRRRNVTDL